MSEANDVIMIPPKARLPEAEALIETIKAYPAEKPIIYDCSKVEDISTPYIIGIIAGLQSREGSSPPAVAINPTEAFVDAFSDLGHFPELMKMEFQS